MSGSATPGGAQGGDKKRQRAQNIVPVLIKDILSWPEETFKVEGQDVGMVVLVGEVRSIEHAATKSVYMIEDKSGDVVECVHWVDVSSIWYLLYL